MPQPEASIHLSLLLYPKEHKCSLSLTGEVTGGAPIVRCLTYDTDMLYERTQEHLNNALRAITNQLNKLQKESK